MAITWRTTHWTPATQYAVGARIVSASAPFVVLACAAAGASASSGSGPAAESGTVVDGSVTWAALGSWSGAVASIAPEVAETDVQSQAAFLALAERTVADAGAWGLWLDDGRRYYAAHLAQLARLQGRGPVSSETVGQLSRGYSALSGDAACHLTSAGRQFLELVRSCVLTGALGAVP